MMLPLELIRARRRKGILRPTYLEAKISIAKSLIAVYNGHIERKRGELNEALSGCEELGFDYRMVRGLASVLQPRATFQTRSKVKPLEVRSRVFLEAGKRVISLEQDRLEVLEQVSQEMGVSTADLEKSLYADLEDEQTLVTFDAPEPTEHLRYYNYALTCALLAYSKVISLSFRGKDEYIDKLASVIGETKINHGKITQLTIKLKPTKRLSKRGARIDSIIGRLLTLPEWNIKAEVGYPIRYKDTVLLELSAHEKGRLIEKDPIETESLIEVVSKKRKLKYGEIIVLEELAFKQGTTESNILKEIITEGINYMNLGGVLITPTKLDELNISLENIQNLGSARQVLKEHGVRNFIPVLESLGFSIDWKNPRNESKIYKLA